MGTYSSEKKAAQIYASAFYRYKTSKAPLPHFPAEKEAPRSSFAKTAIEKVATSTTSRGTEYSRDTLDLRGIPNDLPLIRKDGSTTKLGAHASEAARTFARTAQTESRAAPTKKHTKVEGTPRDVASVYRGVWSHGSKWRTRLTLQGKMYHIGHYETQEDAALAFSKAVYKYRILNIPLPPIPNGSLKEAPRSLVGPTPGTVSESQQVHASSPKRRRERVENMLDEEDEHSQAEKQKRRRRRFRIISHLEEQEDLL